MIAPGDTGRWLVDSALLAGTLVFTFSAPDKPRPKVRLGFIVFPFVLAGFNIVQWSAADLTVERLNALMMLAIGAVGGAGLVKAWLERPAGTAR